MQTNVNTNVERIIAKIDNDYNIDNSDWIPRVAAWVIDGLSQLDALRTSRKRYKLPVNCRIAYSNLPINSPNLIVADCNGCKINPKKGADSCGCDPSTGKGIDFTSNTIDTTYNSQASCAPAEVISEEIYTKDKAARHRVYEVPKTPIPRDYVLVDNNKLELNFDTDYIFIETDSVDTVWSDAYEEYLPVIPNVGILIEAIAYYCLYKILCRGTKHPVFNLAASQYGTNPFYEWKTLKDQAKRAVIIDAQGNILEKDGGIFKSTFFIYTFRPRGNEYSSQA